MTQANAPVESPSLPATSGEELSIQSFRGTPLVLYFYPRDNTPGCTTEGQAFRDLYSEFKTLGCAVVGVSRDSVKTHENFKAKQAFPFELIADSDETLCRQFDVIKEKNMYGKKVMGIERSTFLIDAEGKIAREWRKVKVPGHAEEVLEAVRELS
ncbi:MAG TPA: peroxiredoxin [Wenzhouxiangellaceae bacterium]|nr:peroxiredoxin [Wenzhouxiangellaceae bacterium]